MPESPFDRYLGYQVEDFVMDEAFQHWARNPDADSESFWLQFQEVYPHTRPLVQEASEIVRNIRYQPAKLSQEKQERILQNVYERADKSSGRSKHFPFLSISKKHLAVAATVTLLIFSTVVFWWLFPTYETYETGYQQNKTVQLADGSEVILNANTQLKVRIDLETDQPREVWIDGEAYFHVKRLNKMEIEDKPALKKFVVHTNNFDIEVLGTTFNVASRSETSEVLLQSGSVKVETEQAGQTQILEPGDLLTLSKNQDFQLKKTEPNTNPGWRDNVFIFENTPLRQVARTIENYYDLEVRITDQQLADKIFTAKIPRDQLPLLLEAIEASFGVSATRTERIILIKP